MPTQAEPSRYVHNEYLEAAVDAGIPGMLALMVLVFALVRIPRADFSGSNSERPQYRLASIALIPALLYFQALGALDLTAWPVGRSIIGQIIWATVIGTLMTGTGLLACKLPFPPVWAWRLALVAAAVHWLIDYDLHSAGIIGTLAVVAILASASRQRTVRVTRPRALIGVFAALALGFTFIWSAKRSYELASVADLMQQTRAAMIAEAKKLPEARDARNALAALLNVPRPVQPADLPPLVAAAP